MADWALAIAADLHAGSTPKAALIRACNTQRFAVRAAAAAEVGGDVGRELTHQAAPQDRGTLCAIGICWDLTSRSGGSLASGIEAIVEERRRARAVQDTLDSELASARATARLLTALPLVGLGLGWLTGANPLTWLVNTPAGRATLLLGLGLNAAGGVWTRRITAKIERELS